MHKEEGLSFKNVKTFNLDEYYGLTRDNDQSYWYFMHHNLFDHIDIPAENVHIPDGTVPMDKVEQWCQDYEKAIEEAGGLDFQLLGIGRTGHIGFNEPPSDPQSKTRMIHLHEITKKDAAPAFGGFDNVPSSAITMGVGTDHEGQTHHSDGVGCQQSRHHPAHGRGRDVRPGAGYLPPGASQLPHRAR